MKTNIEFPKEKLELLRSEVKRHPGALSEISKRTGHSISLVSMVLQGKRKLTDKSFNIITETNNIITEAKIKADQLISSLNG